MADVIGRMDRRITIEDRAPDTVDGSGAVLPNWTPVAEGISAQVTRAPGREFLAGGAAQDAGEIVFRIRWRTGIGPTCRVLYGGEYYSVVGQPVEIGRRDRLDVKAVRMAGEE